MYHLRGPDLIVLKRINVHATRWLHPHDVPEWQKANLERLREAGLVESQEGEYGTQWKLTGKGRDALALS